MHFMPFCSINSASSVFRPIRTVTVFLTLCLSDSKALQSIQNGIFNFTYWTVEYIVHSKCKAYSTGCNLEHNIRSYEMW